MLVMVYLVMWQIPLRAASFFSLGVVRGHLILNTIFKDIFFAIFVNWCDFSIDPACKTTV